MSSHDEPRTGARARIAWWTAGLAGVACLGLATAAAWQSHQLDAGLRDPSDLTRFDPTRTNSAEVTSRTHLYNGLLGGTYLTGAVAIVAGGLGAWWTWTGDRRVVLVPSPAGFSLAARF